MKKELKLPKFKNENQERKFWKKVDLTRFFEPKDFVPVSFPNLKLTSRPISIRLPETLIYRLKEMANSRDVPYQSLIKMFLSEKVREEIKKG